MMNLNVVVAQIDRHIGVMFVVVHKILLNHLRLIPAAYNKFVESVVRINLHDMPQYRLAAYFHHGLGSEIGFFAQPCAEATGQKNYFHIDCLFLSFLNVLLTVATKSATHANTYSICASVKPG